MNVVILVLSINNKDSLYWFPEGKITTQALGVLVKQQIKHEFQANEDSCLYSYTKLRDEKFEWYNLPKDT